MEKTIKVKMAIHQEDITIINIYLPNIRVLKFMKQTLTELKGKKKVTKY